MSDLPFRARAFGQDWAADLPLHQFDPVTGRGASNGFALRQINDLPQRDILAVKGRGEIYADGFRFPWSNIVSFDVFVPHQIGYLPLPGWRGTFPDALFSTVTALALAEIGLIPMHASAVEYDGRAYLFAGKAGAGKSTFTAELLANGARLISDDLSVLTPPSGKKGFCVARGRPSMRLHPATAASIDAMPVKTTGIDPRGKLLVQPAARADDIEYPLAGIFLLNEGTPEIFPAEAIHTLPFLIFRPHWMSKMPGNGQRRAWLIDLASRGNMRRLPALSGFDDKARRIRIEAALKAMAG